MTTWTSNGRRWMAGVVAATVLAALTACGGGGDGGPVTPASVTVSGVAAIGAPITNQTVTVVNGDGTTSSAQTDSQGAFSVTIDDVAPFIIRVDDASGNTWYSYTPTAGTVNVNPMTTLALLSANGNQPLSQLVTDWANTVLSSTAVLEAAKKVNANLQNVMTANSVPYTSTNIFNGAFTANGTGMDAVLDDLGVSISCSSNACTQTIDWYNGGGTTTITWNNSIDTTGITLSWSTTGGGTGGNNGGGSGTIGVNLGSCSSNVQAGTYSMVVRTSVAGFGSVPVPDICVDGLPDRPVDQNDFCGDPQVTNQLPNGVSITSCSFSGDTGTIGARITSPITLDYTVSYTFVQR